MSGLSLINFQYMLKKQLFKVIVYIYLIMFSLNTTAQTYNESNRQLMLPMVHIEDIGYANVVVLLDSFSVLTASSPMSNPAPSNVNPQVYTVINQQLTLPSVQVGNVMYSNVVIRLNNFAVLSVGPAQKISLDCVVPIPGKNTVSFETTIMTGICGNIFVDPFVSSNTYAAIASAYKNAIATNKAFYGTLKLTNPDIVACDFARPSRTNCAQFFTGATLRNRALSPGSKFSNYLAPRWTVVLVSAASNANENITAHELSHLELDARLKDRGVPSWFNEGLATYIGNEPGCSGITVKGIQDLTLLTSVERWETHTNNFPVLIPTYCQARNEVAAWINKNGKNALLELIENVANGQNFLQLYGQLQTQ